jgi:hypothetical protein
MHRSSAYGNNNKTSLSTAWGIIDAIQRPIMTTWKICSWARRLDFASRPRHHSTPGPVVGGFSCPAGQQPSGKHGENVSVHRLHGLKIQVQGLWSN